MEIIKLYDRSIPHSSFILNSISYVELQKFWKGKLWALCINMKGL